MGLGRKYLQKIVDTASEVVGLTPFGNHYYVDGFSGVAGNPGTESRPFLTMTAAFAVIASGDTIHLRGRVTEQLVAPLGVFDVTIVGATRNPRQSTNSGAQAGYSAYWKYATDNTTPCLELIEQGWTIENIVFEGPASTSTAAIQLTRAEDAVHPDPSHSTIKGCRFVAGGNAIIDSGGTFNQRIIGNVFQSQTGYAIKPVAGAGIASRAQWHILDNQFRDFANGVGLGDAQGCIIKGNYFTDGSTPNTTVVLSLAGGANNFVVDNYFQTATANFNSPDVVGSATDVWWNVSIDAASAGVDSGHEVGNPA
jgi:hypothetical protein